MAGPRHSQMTPPNASAAASHSALSTAAARNLLSVLLVSTRSAAMSTARTANVAAHAHMGTAVIAGVVPPAAGPGPALASQRGQYLISGAAASRPAGI